jgi:cytochrome c peroxidase
MISRRSRRRACAMCLTGPYFHDGSMQTLWDVMDHYNEGDGITDPWLDIQPLALTETEIDDVVAFLAALTSPQYKNAGDQEYARQQPSVLESKHLSRRAGQCFGLLSDV